MTAQFAARSTRRFRTGASLARRDTLRAHGPADRAQRFAELQQRLAGAVAAADADREQSAIVVVPSRRVDKWHESPAETRAYEERLLCMTLLLRRPNLHLVYVTSEPVAPALVEHWLSLVPSGARARLTLLSANDPSARPLAGKLLARPLLLHRIRRALPDRELAHLVPYSPVAADCELALALGIPLYGADPRHARFGTKSGCRELFASVGIAHPLGVENVTSLAGAVEAVAQIRARKPAVAELVVKLNEGVSGDGNAIVDVRGLPRPGAAAEPAAIERRLRAMAFESEHAAFAQYLARVEAHGAIVEERIIGRELRSPSVQLDVLPCGAVEIAATHDQLLGGPSGQSFLGCRFPADPAYAAAITVEALVVGARLAREGVIGRFAIDFVVVRDEAGAWQQYAIEINLRKGGTTHPLLTLTLLTGGRYDRQRACFEVAGDGPRHLVATDHLTLAPHAATELLLDAMASRGLGFDRTAGTGVVLHMLSSAGPAGRVGLTAIGRSPEQAARLYERAAAALVETAEDARHAASRRDLRQGAGLAARAYAAATAATAGFGEPS